RRAAQLQHDLQELEDHARQLDAADAERAAEADRVARESAEREQRFADMAQRAGAVEGQQAMLAALRGRLERLREDVRRESQLLTEQRARQETAEVELQE